LPRARIEALDISSAAIAVAGENARRNGVAERVCFLEGDLAHLPVGPFDLIVSNPPYIPAADLPGLMPEVRDFEPRLALCGGADGLDCYRLLAAQAPNCLAPAGWLLLEVGIGQADAVRDLLTAAGLTDLFCRKDYAGVPRVVGARKAG